MQSRPGVGGLEDEPAGIDVADGIQRELDRGDRREGAAAAAQSPEEIGLGLRVAAHQFALSGDRLDGQHAVGGQAVPAAVPPDAAPERVADHAGVGRRAVEASETLGAGGRDDIAPEHPGLGTRAATRRVDLQPGHVRRLDEQRALE